LAFSPDGQWLASGSFDGTLRLWNWQVLGDEPQTLPGQLGEVRTVAFSPDGRLLASGGRDGVIRLWDVLKMKKELRFESSKPNEENKTEVLSLAFGASSKTWYLASGHSAEKNKPIKLWKFDNLNTATPKTPQEIVPYRGIAEIHAKRDIRVKKC
jgi:WD40 repeat protein